METLTLKNIKRISLKTALVLCSLLTAVYIQAQIPNGAVRPSRTETINPIHKNSFSESKCAERKQGGHLRTVNGYEVFNGSMDGYRQVDPQIAVGGGYVFHGTNSGLIIYTKDGEFVEGVSQSCFNNGIDPKLFYDMHNKIFAFDLWDYVPQKKPVNISVSETKDPTGAWNTYPVPAPNGVDGGGIGFSRKWMGYSFPGGSERTFILRTADVKAGRPATVYHFNGSLGHPVFTQDNIDDLYFFEITQTNFIIRKVSEDSQGNPYAEVVSNKPHNLEFINTPLPSPQKGTNQKVSSGDRNPKNLVVQNGSIWFSQAVDHNGRSAVQWHQINLANGNIVQTGLIKSATTNYIQTTIAVNKSSDVLIGFQQVDENSFISPRFAFRASDDPLGTVGAIVSAGEGRGATDGLSWGDYSGSMIDGDNLQDLWTIQSIASDQGNGETVIIKVPYSKFVQNQKVVFTNKETNRLLFSDGEVFTGTRGEEGGWLKSPKVLVTDANYYSRAEWYLQKNTDGSFFIINMKTNRLAFSTGDKFTGTRGDEGGWLKSPIIVGADANYYNRAMWYFEKNSDGSYFIRNKETNRYLFSDGDKFTGVQGDEGGWLKSPDALGVDANYYNRAMWYISGPGVNMIKD